MNILIDLSILKNVNCGLGQVALNYGYYFRDAYEPCADEQIYLLVPKNFVGQFGHAVKYVVARKIYRLFPWLIGRRFDVWHAIHQLSRYTPFCRKYVLTIHDFNFVYEKQGHKIDKYLRKIQRKVDAADKIVCISQFAKRETEKFVQLHGKSIYVVYNGIERIDLQPDSRPSQVDATQPFVFTIGEVKEKKNFHVLLDMMSHLPQYQLYIAGKDATPYADAIRRHIGHCFAGGKGVALSSLQRILVPVVVRGFRVTRCRGHVISKTRDLFTRDQFGGNRRNACAILRERLSAQGVGGVDRESHPFFIREPNRCCFHLCNFIFMEKSYAKISYNIQKR